MYANPHTVLEKSKSVLIKIPTKSRLGGLFNGPPVTFANFNFINTTTKNILFKTQADQLLNYTPSLTQAKNVSRSSSIMGYVITNYGKIKSNSPTVILYTVTMYNFDDIEMEKLNIMNMMYILCVCVCFLIYCGTIALILHDVNDGEKRTLYLVLSIVYIYM